MSPTLYTCARCGKRQPIEKTFRSAKTKNRFCLDDAACERRYAKKARAAVRPAR